MAVFQSKYTGQQVEAILNNSAFFESTNLFTNSEGQIYVLQNNTDLLANYNLVVCIGYHDPSDEDILLTCIPDDDEEAVCLSTNKYQWTVLVDSNGFYIMDNDDEPVYIKKLIGIRWIYEN